MYENIASIFLLNKTIAFFVAKPFYNSFWQNHSSFFITFLSFPVSGAYINFDMAKH